jgi:hypothetical protein
MKVIAALLLAVAFVHANSTIRYGWTPGTESVFRFESQVLTGIPDIRNSQFSGMKLHAQARVQAFPDYTLRVKHKALCLRVFVETVRELMLSL